MHLKLLFLALVVLATAHGLTIRKKAEGGQAAAAKSVKREESEVVEVEKPGDSKDSDETEDSDESKASESNSKEKDAGDSKDSGESKDDSDSNDSKDSGESKDDDDSNDSNDDDESNDSKDSGESKDDDESKDSKDSGESKASEEDDSDDSKDSDESKDKEEDSSDSKGSSESKDSGEENPSTEGEVDTLTAETFRHDMRVIIEKVVASAVPLEHTETLAIKYVVEPTKENAVAVGQALQEALGQVAMTVSTEYQSLLWMTYRLITSLSSDGFSAVASCSDFSNLELKGGEFADAAQGITLSEELSKAFIDDVGCFAGHLKDINKLLAETESEILTKNQAFRIIAEGLATLQEITESGERFSRKLAQAFTPVEAPAPAEAESSDENAKRALERLLRTLQSNPNLLNRHSPK